MTRETRTTPIPQMADPNRMRAALEEIVRLDARWTGQPAAPGDLVVESNAYNAKVVGRLGRIALAALLSQRAANTAACPGHLCLRADGICCPDESCDIEDGHYSGPVNDMMGERASAR